MTGLEVGTQFEFSYAPGTTAEQIIGFEMAGEFWSHYLKDNVTMNFHVEMTDYLPENVIGGALPAIQDNVRYQDYRNKLQQDITSSVDSLINNNQQNEPDRFTAYFNSQYYDKGYKIDNNEYLNMTRANAKALGLVNAQSTNLDGYIMMRNLDGVNDGNLNNIRWNYDYQNNLIAQNKLDFLSVAIHEIGHTLGFISGLDQANWLAGQLNTNQGNEDDYYAKLIGKLNNATPLDMLRYSQDSYKMSGGNNENWIDMSVGGNPYLSFTGSGGSAVAYFATGEMTNLGGDGSQASHWKRQDNALGIMDPVLGLSQKRVITNLDKQLFDAIGWNVGTQQLDSQTLYNKSLSNLQTALILDRTNDVQTMIDATLVYKGRSGSSTGGSWQVGLWQHIMFQTLDIEVMDFKPELKLTEFSINNYFAQFTSNNLSTQNQLEEKSQDNTSEKQLSVEQAVVQLIENNEIVASESTSLDLDLLADLSLESLEEMLNLDRELLITAIN
ncbi:MAG: NF038122 family metalloprotease [Waterburya sp.]